MNEKNYGLIIEGFVRGSYARMFDNKIDVRHHPITDWANASISGSPGNFESTKEHVLRTFEGLTHTLYKAGGNDDLLTEFDNLREQLKESNSVGELGEAIDEARPILLRAYER